MGRATKLPAPPSREEREPSVNVFQDPPFDHDHSTFGRVVVRTGIDCFTNPYTDLHFVDQVEAGAPRVSVSLSGHYFPIDKLIEIGGDYPINDGRVRFTEPNAWGEVRGPAA